MNALARAIALAIAVSSLVGLGCGPSPPAPPTDLAERPVGRGTFRFVPPPETEVHSVSVRGSFNGWGETPMEKRSDGSWSVTVPLVPGEHQYKYFVDGKWPLDMERDPAGPLDPDADGYVADGYGGRNAVRVVAGPAAAAAWDPARMAERMDDWRTQVSARSITVYPVIAGGQAVVPIARLAALFLERAGLPDIRVTETEFNVSAQSALRHNATVFGAFVGDAGLATDYALLGEVRGGPQPGTSAVRCIAVDAAGNPVWMDEQVLGADEADPMTCTYRMVDALRTRLGLPDPAREDAPTDGIWAEHWRRAGGVPPDPELAEMEERRGRARAGFAGATVSVLPVIRGHEGDRESAELLTKLLQDAGLCRALSAGPEIVIDSVPGANEQALLWDLARGFREHVRRHGIDTDYALLAQYFLDPETRRAHAVHFVVCDRGGDWVIVDLQNAHHDDFRSVAPTTADACGRLVVERMRHYLTEE